MDINELLLAYLATQLGITEDAAADLLYQTSEDKDATPVLKDNALQALLAKDQERVTALKASAEDKTVIYNKAFADAKKEILPKAEKALAKKYGIEGDSFKLDDLVKDIIAKETEGLTGDPNNLDENAVKKHPAYLARERELKQELDTLVEEHTTEVSRIQADYARTETLGDVQDRVLSIFDGLRPVLSKDTVRAGNQRTDFAEKFKTYDYELQADKSYLILDAGGKRIEDGHGNPITLEKFVEQKASSTFDFAVQDAKGGSGNDGDGKGGKVTVPTSDDEYNMAMLNATSAEERESIAAAYTPAT